MQDLRTILYVMRLAIQHAVTYARTCVRPGWMSRVHARIRPCICMHECIHACMHACNDLVNLLESQLQSIVPAALRCECVLPRTHAHMQHTADRKLCPTRNEINVKQTKKNH